MQTINLTPLPFTFTFDFCFSEKQRAELDSIPKLFLQPNFNLENPDTFNAVFPWSQVEPGKQDAATVKPATGKRHSSKLLQEKVDDLNNCIN